MGLFNKKENISEPDWVPQMKENQERWFVFLEKMQAKLKELCDAAVPELQQAYEEDTDVNKRAHGSMLSGINGQLEQMRKKADGVYEEKISSFFYHYDALVDFSSPYQNVLRKFREECYKRKNIFENTIHHYRDVLSKACEPDWEEEYQKVLDEFEAIKNKFKCKQCGAAIPLEKIYFISAYITCKHCNTQNTFVPGSQASMLQSIGRSLAEQRTAHLLEAHALEQQKERDLYHKMHENRVSHTDDAATKKIKEEQNTIWKKEREDAIANAPGLYEIYLQAMFTEWNNIVPDLAKENEKFYERMLSDFRKHQ